MLFKNKKSNGSLKTLSENDIQKKLYGDYRPEGRFTGRPVASETKPAAPAVANVALREAPSIDPAKDLFTFPGISAAEKSDSISNAKDALIKDSKSDQARMNRLEHLAKVEQRVTAPKAKAVEKRPAVDSARMGIAIAGRVRKVGGIAGSLVQTVARILAKFLVVILGGVMRLVKWFDFSRPQVRRASLSILGVAVLAFLFSSIHLLNVRREKAMKVAPPKMAAHKSSSKAKVSSDAMKRADESKTAASSAAAQPAMGTPAVTGNTAAAGSSVSAESAVTKRYVIQIATYSSVADADRIVTSLKENQISAFSKGLSRPSGKIYYAVFIGRFSSFDEAQSRLESFKNDDAAKSFQDAFIRTLD